LEKTYMTPLFDKEDCLLPHSGKKRCDRYDTKDCEEGKLKGYIEQPSWFKEEYDETSQGEICVYVCLSEEEYPK
jgi:hypothetical protein